MGASCIAFRIATLLLITATVTWTPAVACYNNCNGRGSVAYSGSHFCRCKCLSNQTLSGGLAETVEYVAPDCQYTTAQVGRIKLLLGRPLAGFQWPLFEAALQAGLDMDAATSSLFRLRFENVSSTSFELTLDVRANGAKKGQANLAPHTHAIGLLTQYVESQQRPTWVDTWQIASVTQTQRLASPSNKDPAIAANLGSYNLAWESLFFVVLLVVVPFMILFTDMIATDNFIGSNEAGQELLDEYLRLKMMYQLGIVEEGVQNLNVAAAKRDYEAAPKEEWLKDAEEDEDTDEPQPQPLQRKNTRNLRAYSQSFYAQAQKEDTPHSDMDS